MKRIDKRYHDSLYARLRAFLSVSFLNVHKYELYATNESFVVLMKRSKSLVQNEFVLSMSSEGADLGEMFTSDRLVA